MQAPQTMALFRTTTLTTTTPHLPTFSRILIQVRLGNVKSHTSQGGPRGGSLFRLLWHEATESIASSPWMWC